VRALPKVKHALRLLALSQVLRHGLPVPTAAITADLEAEHAAHRVAASSDAATSCRVDCIALPVLRLSLAPTSRDAQMLVSAPSTTH
jgi:hypothetical protein